MKIGEGALAAMGRMGLDELAQALPAFPESIHPQEEPGAPGTATQAIVTDQMGFERGHHDEHLPPLEPMEPSMPEPEIEMGE
ncbi:MAG TPA: hypothetical protein VG826_18715 [Pirellulales bacterium]|nr:hypothetical protein [Pirellulales bacterium]